MQAFYRKISHLASMSDRYYFSITYVILLIIKLIC